MNLDIFIGCFSVGRDAVCVVTTVYGHVLVLVEALTILYPPSASGLNGVTVIAGKSVNCKVSPFKIRKPF